MRRVWFLLVVAAACLGALVATCDERRNAPSVRSDAVADGEPSPEAAPRKQFDAPAADEKPAETSSSAPRSDTPEAGETTVFPAGARVAAPRHVLRGRVVNARREPIAGASVRLESRWLPPDVSACPVENLAQSKATTGADGAFALAYFEGGDRTLHVAARNFGPQWYGVGLRDDRVHEIVLADTAARVVIRTKAAESDRSIEMADVAIVGATPLGRYELTPRADSTKDGVTVVRDVPAGPASIRVAAFGFAPIRDRRVVVPSSGEIVVDVELSAGVTLRGRVVDAATGVGVAGADVRLSGRDADPAVDVRGATDAAGRFALEHAPIAPHAFEAFVARADGFAETKFLAGGFDAQATVGEVSVRLQRPSRVMLRCVGGDGRPLSGAIVAVFSDYDASPRSGARSVQTSGAAATTDVDGRATIAGLHPGGDGIELRTRFYVDGVLVVERAFPSLVAGETRDLGDVVLAPPK